MKQEIVIPESISSRTEFKRKFSFWEMYKSIVFVPRAIEKMRGNKKSNLVANSGSIRTPILETFGQPFRKHPDTCSGIIRTLILETSGH